MSAKKKIKRSNLAYIAVLLVAVAVFAVYYFSQKPDKSDWVASGSFVMQVIDVGQGDSILLGCDDEYMLIDSGEEEYSEKVIEYIGDKRLKYVVATHPHSDHIGGMEDIINAVRIDTFMMPEKEHTSKIFAGMLDAIESNDVSAQYIYAGDKFKLGSADITVISPEEGYSSANLNNWSAVLLVEYQGRKILLTGDSETSVEEIYINRLLGKVDILKLAHHGSDTSSGEDLLDRISPDYVAISVGAGNKYQHPMPQILKRVASHTDRIHRTDEVGDITFTIKEGVISVAQER